MKSATLPSFWEKYNSLDSRVKEQARKAYRLWLENPFHRSLHFKCINQEENIWSARITRGYRSGDFAGRYRDMVLDWKPR
jgi:hypothetical protein